MDKALSPVKGKVRRLLDGADRHVHLVEMANTVDGKKHVGVFVTMGPHLMCLNEDLGKLKVLPGGVGSVHEDFFPDKIIATLRHGFRENLNITDVKYQTHAAVLCPTTAATSNQGQE